MPDLPRPGLTPEQRKLRAQIAAHTRWSREDDRAGATEKARTAFLERFEREVDPDCKLDPAERSRRAAHARKAYFARLALRSTQARKGGDAA